MEKVLARLRAEQAANGREALLDWLKPNLSGGPTRPSYAELAFEFGITEDALRIAVYRLRLRYRSLLRKEIAPMVGRPEEIDEVLRQLFSAPGGG